jgi:hypothetical protein
MPRKAPDPDDKETDIADDPLLSAISGELDSARKQGDRSLFIALALALAVVLLLSRLQIKSVWLDLLQLSVLASIIGGTIYSVVRQKQRVAARHGLVCPACGYRPWVTMILSAATTHRCSKCGSSLPVV